MFKLRFEDQSRIKHVKYLVNINFVAVSVVVALHTREEVLHVVDRDAASVHPRQSDQHLVLVHSPMLATERTQSLLEAVQTRWGLVNSLLDLERCLHISTAVG